MNEIKYTKNSNSKYGFYSAIALMILLLFPFYDDGVKSYSLLSFGYGKAINLRSFYMELHAFLKNNGFKDTLPVENYIQKGNLPNAKELTEIGGGRNSDMYEEEFFWFDNGNGAFDITITWKAKRKSDIFPNHAKINLKFNMVNRRMMSKEILQGNNKVTLQDGNWEHRSDIVYTNTFLKEKMKKFDKIPFFSNKYLLKVYNEMFYHKDIEHDIELAKRKIVDGYMQIIEKHFL